MKYEIEEVETLKVEEEAIAYGIPKSEMATILGVSEKTYYNIMRKDRLDTERSDRFNFLRQVFESGEETFGSKENFSSWMKTPQPALENHTPIDMLSSITGTNIVLQVLGRIKHGITA